MKAPLILIPFLLAASAAAFAERADKRLEGPITIEEAEAREAERFDRLDADEDGSLTREEFFAEEGDKGRIGKRRQRVFDRLDADGDGTVSAEEYGKRIERLAALDSDGDGQLTSEELRAEMPRRKWKRQRDG